MITRGDRRQVANPELQTRLRRMIDVRDLTPVAAELGVAPELLARYLLNVRMRGDLFAQIERKLVDGSRCPRCNSPDRAFHPVKQWRFGEIMTTCPDPWHEAASAASKGAPVGLRG